MFKYTKYAMTIALLTVFLAACGSDEAKTPATSTDAGAAADTASSEDGSTGTDVATSDAGATTDAGPAAKYNTCSEVGTCVSVACVDNKKDCEKPCLADASADALKTAAPLLSCYQDKCVAGKCKDSKDPKCGDSCMTEMCAPDLIACIDTPASGKETCSVALTCFDKCDLADASGFGCYTACLDALTPEDTALLKSLASCMGDNPGKDLEKVCSKEFFGCVIGSKSGDQGCHTVFACSEECIKAGGTEDSCMSTCVAKLTKESQTAFMATIPCLGDSNLDSDPKCAAALKTCIAPSGKGSCSETFDCTSKCETSDNEDDTGCMFGCLHESTSDSYDAFLALAKCGGDGEAPPPGGVTPTNDDTNAQCIQSMVSCAAPSGKGDCGALQKCFETCEKKQKNDGNPMSCIFDCADVGSSQAYADLITFSQCNDKCENECSGKGDSCSTTCMTTNCPAAVKTCMP